MPQAYCGQNCEECPVYNLKYTDKQKTHGLVAKNWSATFGVKFTRKDMCYDGCQSKNRMEFCRDCDIEACCHEKGVETCLVCAEREGCERYGTFWEWFEHNKPNLMWDKVKKD